jgi:hypothetical protein
MIQDENMRYYSSSYTPDHLKRELDNNTELTGSTKDDSREVFVI